MGVSAIDNDLPAYELNISPRASISSQSTSSSLPIEKTSPAVSEPPSAKPRPTPQPSPSLRLLFSFLSQRHFFFILCPAMLCSIISGGIAPFMTYVIGQQFNVFAQFPLTPNPPQAAKDTLLRGIGLASMELVGLALASFSLGSITSSLWIWVGEVNTREARKRVYEALAGKDMEWFDVHMGEDGSDSSQSIGAAGLMAKISSETDDVRSASSLASGMILQYLTTTLACLVMAFIRSWALTLVILSAVPLLILIQSMSQRFATPLLEHVKHETAVAATTIDRAVSGISTVKAFNAHDFEASMAQSSFERLFRASKRLYSVWGLTSGLSQFVAMAMFVQGFWFGGKLVREGKIQAGDVMAVFWACLIATSNLQMCLPRTIILTKGKVAVVGLVSLINDNNTSSSRSSPATMHMSPVSPSPNNSPRSQQLRKITPQRCHGELALHSVTFSYPSRPTHPVLHSVSLFLPANEITFIVGSSGSGKSTVAQLLLRMYEAQSGMVLIDEQDIRFLDEAWVRRCVGVVGQMGAQGVIILEGRTIFENVLLGLGDFHTDQMLSNMDSTIQFDQAPKALKAKVEASCRAAMLHEFIRDLPAGYDTILSDGGVGLSGGQKQRLALARAVLRDPKVLILDEPTSSLDPTTRLLVFSALKQQRMNKTTVVITHDLSMIGKDDFVYVMKDGKVVEGGYRADLELVDIEEEDERGEFRRMMEIQRSMGGVLPAKEPSTPHVDDDDDDDDDDNDSDESKYSYDSEDVIKDETTGDGLVRWGEWMFDVVADLTGHTTHQQTNGARAKDEDTTNANAMPKKLKPKLRPLSIPSTPSFPHDADREFDRGEITSKRFSLPSSPTTAVNPHFSHMDEEKCVTIEEDDEFDGMKTAILKSAISAKLERNFPEYSPDKKVQRKKWDDVELKSIRVDERAAASAVYVPRRDQEYAGRMPFFPLMRAIYPTIPAKPVFFLGILISLLSGAATPVFSYLLSRLLFEVSIGAQQISMINFYGGIVLAVVALDGLLMGLKFFVMESLGMAWVTRIRSLSLSQILRQDKTWFDDTKHSSQRISQVLVQDGDDAANLIGVVIAQSCVVFAMWGIGITWAFIRGWQLTLAGYALSPVFGGAMIVQSKLVEGCELRNKRAREEVANCYYAFVVNVRGIRAMSLDSVFKARFQAATDKALSTGVKGAFVEGCTYGVSSGLIYLAEALLFYTGAVLISKGIYTYLQMIQVLNLVVFSVTLGSQLMAFTHRIAKTLQATSDFNQLLHLAETTSESTGSEKPSLDGSITFSHVSFAYPSRPTQHVLKDVNLTIQKGECVALVGSSGSGKSTVAALLQRLYEPSEGEITFGGDEEEGEEGRRVRLGDVDVQHLRRKVAVVSQVPGLFDKSVAENIRYGAFAGDSPSGATNKNNDDDSSVVVISDVAIRTAAKQAQIHSFIMDLPQGYDTPVGENAALISGGQAQRVQIARALARVAASSSSSSSGGGGGATTLVLDECTSALDGENEKGIVESILSIRRHRSSGSEEKLGGRRLSTLMITHKLQVMQMCDRIVVMHEGRVAEQGTYQELIDRKGGVFAGLASGGEWVG